MYIYMDDFLKNPTTFGFLGLYLSVSGYHLVAVKISPNNGPTEGSRCIIIPSGKLTVCY